MRLRSMLAFGVGYLVGTKAGRERYQELSENLRALASSDITRDAMGRVREGLGFSADRGESSGDGQQHVTQEESSQGSSASEGSSSEEGSSGESSPEGTDKDWEDRGDGAWVPKDADEDESGG